MLPSFKYLVFGLNCIINPINRLVQTKLAAHKIEFRPITISTIWLTLYNAMALSSSDVDSKDSTSQLQRRRETFHLYFKICTSPYPSTEKSLHWNGIFMFPNFSYEECTIFYDYAFLISTNLRSHFVLSKIIFDHTRHCSVIMF